MSLLGISYRVAKSFSRKAWNEDDITIDIINPVEEGVDQEMASTHSDMSQEEIAEVPKLDLPSHKS